MPKLQMKLFFEQKWIWECDCIFHFANEIVLCNFAYKFNSFNKYEFENKVAFLQLNEFENKIVFCQDKWISEQDCNLRTWMNLKMRLHFWTKMIWIDNWECSLFREYNIRIFNSKCNLGMKVTVENTVYFENGTSEFAIKNVIWIWN